MTPKQRAAEAALAYVSSGMVVGLGTGTTSDCFLQALAAALKSGRLRDIRGISTSKQSERRAMELGIPITSLVETPQADVTIDGADEIDPKLDLIKGLGGALVREKIVAQNSRRLIIIADASKSVDRLGTRSPLPVEVVPFGYQVHEVFFRQLGAEPLLRRNRDGSIYTTDNGNHIYDCRFASIDRPRELENTLHLRAGVVDTGLFVAIAERAIIADERGIEERIRKHR